MSKNKLTLIDNIDYSHIIVDLLTPFDYEKKFTKYSFNTIVLVALTTGLPLKGLTSLKWGDILEYDEKGRTKCLDRINLERGYDFSISNKVRKQILTFYTYRNQPRFKRLIIDDGFWKYQTRKKWLTKLNYTVCLCKTKESIQDKRLEILNDHLTQIIFGRRVIETCGYSNKIANFLKGLYNIKTSQQLFTFLGFKSRNDFKYKLSNISLAEGVNNRFSLGEPKSFLNENKHFLKLKKGSNEYYPFQHFQVFYDFLNILRLGYFDVKVKSVLVLLMISLTNGIRPSSLLKLIWSDFFVAGKNGILDCYTLKDSIKISRHQIKLDHNTKKKILLQFKCLFLNFDSEIDIDNYQLTILKELPDPKIHGLITIDNKLILKNEAPSLNDSCFITNKMNTLTQPSLNREIKNALREVGFQHADKFKTESTMIMYGRRILDLKGNHTPTIRALVKHFNRRSKKDLFKFLYIDFERGSIRPKYLGEFTNIFEHVLYDI
ncbi:hypothetical protein [Lutibacter flavus]|uniref:Uncharacterized protein n=1 Tax=Lutibacter flavus TaxID=691689 RepID=A0A238VI96_9FLAO|nr:hypothetical protein [Lutibacter flavus]SNR33847.1 hypothetical protein SAMN04488111_0515 [Lutibacter flavus]